MNRTRFTDNEIVSLRSQFAQIATVNPDRLSDFRTIFTGCSNAALEQLSGAQIKFVSTLAVNALNRRREA